MKADVFSISGKHILITGSSRGIGLVLARELGLRGATIILNGTSQERLEQAAAQLTELGIRVITAAFDITDEPGCAAAVAAVLSQTGAIDVLINNAGIQIRRPAETFEIADFDSILSVNLKGAFIVSKIVGNAMIAQKSGKIINVCSIQSELGRAFITPYAASKGGLKLLTKGLATEWGKHNIQVNGLGPGYFVTDMTKALSGDPEFSEWLCKRVPAGRWGDPEELAGAAIFLSSAASNYVTGQILYVDGGMLACV